MKANISTFVNWWTRYNPLLALPAAPASVRKQCDRPAYFNGSFDASRISSACIPPSVISAVPTRLRSVFSTE